LAGSGRPETRFLEENGFLRAFTSGQ